MAKRSSDERILALTRYSRPAFPGARVLAAGLVAAGLAAVAAPRDSAAGYADIVIDVQSGAILHQRNADTLNYPASLTKIMTLYMVFDALHTGQVRLDDKLPVSKRAARRPASRLGLKKGQTIRLDDAIAALTTKSANDVATVIAEFLGGTEENFAAMMTAQARRLGMSRTTFRNASGLPDKQQRSTARDMSILARALYADFPSYTPYFAMRKFKYRGRTYRNHNNLLGRYAGVEGIKTGYTNASGYNLVISTRHEGRHIVAVVLGGRTAKRRDRQMRRLLDRSYAALTKYAFVFDNRARPKYKPDPALVMAGGGGGAVLVATDSTRFERAAAAVGEAITHYVSIPSALAYPDLGREWGVQVGAFTERKAADRALREAMRTLPELLAATEGRVIAVIDKDRVVFRARRVGMTEADARQACALLAKRHVTCFVAAPTPPS